MTNALDEPQKYTQGHADVLSSSGTKLAQTLERMATMSLLAGKKLGELQVRLSRTEAKLEELNKLSEDLEHRASGPERARMLTIIAAASAGVLLVLLIS